MMAQSTLRDWLRRSREINNAHLMMMALRYDLDGALDADQGGVAWWAQERILLHGVQLVLLEAGVVPARLEDPDRSFHDLDVLGGIDPVLADEVWELWLRARPVDDLLRREVARTLAFVSDRLGLRWTADRRSTVVAWADSTQVLRTIAREVGIAESDTWYLTSARGASGGWYDDVMRALDDEGR